MVIVTLLKDMTSFLGLAYFGTIVWKVAKGYPMSRWFA